MDFEDMFASGLSFGIILLLVVGFIGMILIAPFVLMLAWNFVMPSLFGLPEINFFMAIALWLIFIILFGGITSSK